jgi:GntR family transcriptional regulator, transcriptional repressor for pyruvate dehydrogenase complex
MTKAGPDARSPAIDAVFEPVHPPTTFEETVERLGTAVRLGLLAPRSRLPAERDLAGELGISRSTLRQAITTLVQSGHLVSRRGRSGGTFVADEPPLAQDRPGQRLESREARAVLDYRLAVETGVVLLAAERVTQEDLARLDDFTERMAATEGARFQAYRRADVRFHIGLAEACHSPRLVAAMTEAQGLMTDLIERIAHPDVVLTRANAQHRRLIALLRRRDAGGAVQLMREHCAGTEHILAGLLPET